MSRARAGVLAAVVLLLVVGAVARLVVTNGPEVERAPQGLEDVVVPSHGVIRWSPDATKLVVLVDAAAVFVRVADGRELARIGTAFTDAAWMPDATRAIVVEGPIPTGQIVAVRPDGRLSGTTKLTPSIAFAEGFGLAVNSDGTEAAAITTRRDAIGGLSHTDLALVNLQTGRTRVFATEQREESNPVFVDDGTVAYASQPPGGQIRLHVLDVASGTVRGHGQIHDGPYAVLPSGEVVVGHRAAQGASRLDAVDLGGGTRVLGVTSRHARPVAVDRFGTRVLVRRYGGERGTRLRIEILSK